MSAPTVRHTLAGRHLVVTGVTGFVGKVWLSHLLTHVPAIGRVTLLVRSGGRVPALERMARAFDTSPAFRPLREAHGDALGTFLQDRVRVVEADLTRPRCGLTLEAADALSASADAFVHFAGLTDFHPDPKKGVPANVDGTAEVARLAEASRAGRLLHVSTAFVAGLREGVVEETLEQGVSPLGHRFDIDAEIGALHQILEGQRTPAARTEAAAARARALGWPNLYTFTKGLAEHDLARRDLELAIVRPSVVECARTFPFAGWNEGLNTSAPIMWYCGTAFPWLPSTARHVFDIVPVDAVARWTTVALAALLRGEAERVWHFASGDVNPATFERIVELTALGKREHARRRGAEPWERLVARLDVSPRARDDQGPWTPHAAERRVRDVLGWLEGVPPTERLPGPLRWLLGDTVERAAKDARGRLRESARTLASLRRVLDQYQPFIHDHDWTFRTDHVRQAVRALAQEDRHAFGDELATLDWRSYWLDVQYPGMVRWAFPIVHGHEVPDDPPSVPPLRLTEPATANLAEEVA